MSEKHLKEIESLKRQWIIVSSLSEEILEQSDYPDSIHQGCEYTKHSAWEQINVQADNRRSQASLLRFHIKEQFEFWSRIDIWTELFWQKAEEVGLKQEREEPIRKLLERGKFKPYEAMHTRYQWKRLKESGLPQGRYSAADLEAVEKIIAVDEQRRLALLKKCLRLKRVASSDYLNYGAALAYFTRGELFAAVKGSLLEQHFSEPEIQILQAIWK
jgi:hypothetical protein